MTKAPLTVILASPRGFCAGVDRAIRIVELALEKYGAPVYVRHEIVHNRHVVEQLQGQGAIFVEELDEVPAAAPVVFSAHGVPKTVPAEAERRNLAYVDATCPLVSKVHREAERHHRLGRHIIMIGHAGHPEVIGTLGQLPAGAISLIETAEEAATITPPGPGDIAFITQTTLSVDDTADIVAVLKQRFPGLHGPAREDICYATTNRQEAVKDIAPQCDLFLVIGAANSSNSVRLVEVAQRSGCVAYLIESAQAIDWAWFGGVATLGLSAGASAPEALVEEVLQALEGRFLVIRREGPGPAETVSFKLPRALTA